MARPKPPSPAAGETLSGRSGPLKRVAAIFGLTTALTTCTLVACALCLPVTVFGAEAEEEVSPPPTPSVEAGSSEAVPELVSADRLNGALTPSTGTLFTSLAWGTGDGQVGLLRPADGLAQGPEALAVASDGRLAVLDSVNRRVVFLDAAGAPPGWSALPLAEPRFVAVDDERVYVLDCDADHRLVSLSWSGEILSSHALPELPDVVTSLFATKQGPCVEIAHEQVFRVVARGLDGRSAAVANAAGGNDRDRQNAATLKLVPGRPAAAGAGRWLSARCAPGKNPRVAAVENADGAPGVTRTADLDLGLPAGRSIEHLVSLDADRSDGLTIGARVTGAFGSHAGACLVLRRFEFQKDGRLAKVARPGDPAAPVDSLVLTDSSLAYVGQPYIVAPDGRVFQPVATTSGYAIYVHTFGSYLNTEPSTEVAQ